VSSDAGGLYRFGEADVTQEEDGREDRRGSFRVAALSFKNTKGGKKRHPPFYTVLTSFDIDLTSPPLTSTLILVSTSLPSPTTRLPRRTLQTRARSLAAAERHARAVVSPETFSVYPPQLVTGHAAPPKD